MGEKTQIFPPICTIIAAKNTNAYANVCKFIQNAEKELTRRKSRATMQSKLNRLIEARYSSVPPARPEQPGKGKGPPPKCLNDACCPGAGSAENICRTVTSFCGVLSMAVWSRPRFTAGCCFTCSMDRLRRRFFFCPRRGQSAEHFISERTRKT